MSTLAETIDQLESHVLSLIDDIELTRHAGGCADLGLRDELIRAREDLVKAKLLFEKECESYKICNL